MPGTPASHYRYFRWQDFERFIGLLFNRTHLLRTLINIEATERFLVRWCITENFSLKVLKFLVLIYGFLLS